MGESLESEIRRPLLLQLWLHLTYAICVELDGGCTSSLAPPEQEKQARDRHVQLEPLVSLLHAAVIAVVFRDNSYNLALYFRFSFSAITPPNAAAGFFPPDGLAAARCSHEAQGDTFAPVVIVVITQGRCRGGGGGGGVVVVFGREQAGTGRNGGGRLAVSEDGGCCLSALVRW